MGHLIKLIDICIDYSYDVLISKHFFHCILLYPNY
jgi:hypothetical protein